MENDHQIGLGTLNLKILFTPMINYMDFFDFVATIF
jgi:hypothetical protein